MPARFSDFSEIDPFSAYLLVARPSSLSVVQRLPGLTGLP